MEIIALALRVKTTDLFHAKGLLGTPHVGKVNELNPGLWLSGLPDTV